MSNVPLATEALIDTDPVLLNTYIVVSAIVHDAGDSCRRPDGRDRILGERTGRACENECGRDERRKFFGPSFPPFQP